MTSWYHLVTPSESPDVMWINEAKKDETRQRRIVKTIEMLKKGKKGV